MAVIPKRPNIAKLTIHFVLSIEKGREGNRSVRRRDKRVGRREVKRREERSEERRGRERRENKRIERSEEKRWE